MALNALNSPLFGWVTTYFSCTMTPPPTVTSEIGTAVPCGADAPAASVEGDSAADSLGEAASDDSADGTLEVASALGLEADESALQAASATAPPDRATRPA